MFTDQDGGDDGGFDQDGEPPSVEEESFSKLTVVLHYCKAIETYIRIALLQSYSNLQSYCTTTKL